MRKSINKVLYENLDLKNPYDCKEALERLKSYQQQFIGKKLEELFEDRKIKVPITTLRP